MTMKERFEDKVCVARCAVGGMAVAAPLLLGTVTSFASSASAAINGVIPIALPLVGVSLVITIGLKVFKRIAGKA